MVVEKMRQWLGRLTIRGDEYIEDQLKEGWYVYRDEIIAEKGIREITLQHRDSIEDLEVVVFACSFDNLRDKFDWYVDAMTNDVFPGSILAGREAAALG